ncbi:hypothetical protein BKA69DRAFT_1086784 [Paraphysoderma sedebokerense]|nr:hypothetical protein BKA69DRAFT_1086784 [Paraphysoderma sedebokerense]
MVGTFEKGVFKVDEDAAKERLIASDTKEPSMRKHVSSNVTNEFHRPENRVAHETAFNRPASPVHQVNTSNQSYSQSKDQSRIHSTDQPSSMRVGELEASSNPSPSVYPQLSSSSLPFSGTAASLLSSTLNSVLDVPGAVPPKLPLQEQEYAKAVQWHYCDPVGNIQGPFTSEQMQNWYEGKYLPNDLPVRATFQSSSGHVSDSGNFELLRIFIMKYCGNDYATPFLSAKKKSFSPSPSFLSDPLSAFPTPSLLFQPGYQQTQQPSLNRTLQHPTTFDPFGSAAINQLPASNTEQRVHETGYGWGWTGAPQDSQLGATVDAGISTHFLGGLSLNPQSGRDTVAGFGQSERVTEELNDGPRDPFSLEGLLNQSAKLPRERHTTGNAVMDGTTEQDRPDVGYEQAWKSTVSSNTVTAQFHDENGPAEVSVNENLSRLNIGSDESSSLIPSPQAEDTTAGIVETNDSPVSKARPSATSPISESRRNLQGSKKTPKSDDAAVTHKATEATGSQRKETHTKQKLDIGEKHEATEEEKDVGLSASAPWATQNKQNGKLTLQEIMKQEEKRKTKVPATRQTGALSPPPADSDIMPTTISWGIAPSAMTGKANVTQQISHVQPAAWSTPQNLPVKKSLADIQREEEEREKAKRLADKEKQALSTGSAASAGGWGSGVNVVRRYADTVGTGVTSISSNNQAVVNVVAAKPQTAESNPWLTVGTKAMAKAPAQSAPARPPVIQPVAAAPQPKVNISVMTGPSEDFVKWCKSSLSRLSNSINLDDFLKMLLEFPVEDDSVSNTTNMIHELILSVSTTIDGRKFADEFVKKRRADLGVVDKLDNSTSDKGFQVVKNVKKNRRK